MPGANALFVDLGNLNVLFKVNGTFVLGANYSSCPAKIVEDSLAMGQGQFSVYLSMLPRPAEESDVIFPGLSIGGVPFGALKEEIMSVVNIFEGASSLGALYLCNSLANLMLLAKVERFQSVINYGSRVALVSCEDKMLKDLKVFDTRADLMEEMGADFSCYGDLDLIDIDSLKAQYPEWSKFSKQELIQLVPLITSELSPHKILIEEQSAELQGETAEEDTTPQKAETVLEPKPVVEPKAAVEPVEQAARAQQLKREPKVKARAKRDPLLAVLSVVAVLGVSISAASMGLWEASLDIEKFQQEEVNLSDKTVAFETMATIYERGIDRADSDAKMLKLCRGSELPVELLGFESFTDRAVLQISCDTKTTSDQYVDYLNGLYIVADVVETGVSADGSGSAKEYSITLTE